MQSREESAPAAQPKIYCLVPRGLASKLHELLRRHFGDDPTVEVVVEQRSRGRRQGAERRTRAQPVEDERRLVRNPGGRRVGERRATFVPVAAPALPRRARALAEQLVFVERLEASTLELEDLDTARVVTRIQAGDDDGTALLYLRYFERVYGYLRVALKNVDDAEEGTQEIFMRVLRGLPGYELRDKPFRAWLFTIARNYSINWLQRQHNTDLVDPAELSQLTEGVDPAGGEIRMLSAISDPELLMLIERLPLAQRQAIALRHMLGLSNKDIAAVMGRSPSDVRMLQSRALAFLRQRLQRLDRQSARHVPRSGLQRSIRPANVLRSRRYALVP